MEKRYYYISKNGSLYNLKSKDVAIKLNLTEITEEEYNELQKKQFENC